MNVNNTTSSVSSNNGFSGMISGMDTDSLVEKLLSATQTKIDNINVESKLIDFEKVNIVDN